MAATIIPINASPATKPDARRVPLSTASDFLSLSLVNLLSTISLIMPPTKIAAFKVIGKIYS